MKIHDWPRKYFFKDKRNKAAKTSLTKGYDIISQNLICPTPLIRRKRQMIRVARLQVISLRTTCRLFRKIRLALPLWIKECRKMRWRNGRVLEEQGCQRISSKRQYLLFRKIWLFYSFDLKKVQRELKKRKRIREAKLLGHLFKRAMPIIL